MTTLADLGIDLEEDSPDFGPDEAADAVETASEDDFVRAVVAFANGKRASYDLRRLAGALYARVTVGEDARLFRLPWLKKEPNREPM